MANKQPKGDHDRGDNQTFLKILIASGLGAALAVGAGQWIDGGRSPDVDQQILEELRSISAALRGGAPAAAGSPQPPEIQIPDPPKDIRLSIADSPSLGRANAKVVMVEFSDFDCPFCGRFSANTKGQLIKEYVDTGKLRYVFRQMPLKNLHPNAPREAEAAECARRQNRFWEIYPRLFANPNNQPMSEADLRSQAVAAGVEPKAFDTCLAGQATAKVMTDLNDGARAGIMGTPTFFFGSLDENGRLKVETRLVGADPIEKFRSIIDPLLGR